MGTSKTNSKTSKSGKAGKPVAKKLAAKPAKAAPKVEVKKAKAGAAKAAPAKVLPGKKVPAPAKGGKLVAFVKEKILGKPAAVVAPTKGAPVAKGAKAAAAPVAVATPPKGKKSKGGYSTSIYGNFHGHSPESVCREVACEGLATTGGYCRMHYIKNWKKIKRKEVILREKKLDQYIEELVIKYPDKYIEAIRQDLAHDKDFAKVIYDLDLDESVDDFEGDGDGDENLIDVIKRDIDGEGEGY